MEMASDAVSFLSIALLYALPLVVIAVVVFGAFRVFAPTERKLPEDLPSDLFDGNTDKLPKEEAKAAKEEFKETYRSSIRRRFATVLERMNAFFNIQKRY